MYGQVDLEELLSCVEWTSSVVSSSHQRVHFLYDDKCIVPLLHRFTRTNIQLCLMPIFHPTSTWRLVHTKPPIYQKRNDEQIRPPFFLRNKIGVPTRPDNLLRALLVYMRRVGLNVSAGTLGHTSAFCLEEGMVGVGRELFCFAGQEGRTGVLEITGMHVLVLGLLLFVGFFL